MANPRVDPKRTQCDRDMIDAIRAMLGMGPLYAADRSRWMPPHYADKRQRGVTHGAECPIAQARFEVL